MTAKEKANELIKKFTLPSGMMNSEIKQCALIAVEEILSFLEQDDKDHGDCHWINSSKYKFWERVKQEINEL